MQRGRSWNFQTAEDYDVDLKREIDVGRNNSGDKKSRRPHVQENKDDILGKLHMMGIQMVEADPSVVPNGLWDPWKHILLNKMDTSWFVFVLIPKRSAEYPGKAIPVSGQLRQLFFTNTIGGDTTHAGARSAARVFLGTSFRHPAITSGSAQQTGALYRSSSPPRHQGESPGKFRRQVTWVDESVCNDDVAISEEYVSYLVPLTIPGMLIDRYGHMITTKDLSLRREERAALEEGRRWWRRRRSKDQRRFLRAAYGNVQQLVESPQRLHQLWDIDDDSPLLRSPTFRPVRNTLDRLRLKYFLLHHMKPPTPSDRAALRSLCTLAQKERFLNSLWRKQPALKKELRKHTTRSKQKSHTRHVTRPPLTDLRRSFVLDSVASENRKRCQERYDVEEEAHDQKLWKPCFVTSRPLVLLPILLTLILLGGNPLAATNCLKVLLFRNEYMAWMPTYEANFHLNNVLAASWGCYFFLFPVNIFTVNMFGPKVMAVLALWVMATGWGLLSQGTTPGAALAGLCCLGAGTSALFYSVQCIANVFAADSLELDILCFVSLCDALAAMWPKTAEMVAMLDGSPLDSAGCLALFGVAMVFAGVLSFFCLPWHVPPPRMRSVLARPFRDRVKEMIDPTYTPSWVTLLWDEPTRSSWFRKGSDVLAGIRLVLRPEATTDDSSKESETLRYDNEAFMVQRRSRRRTQRPSAWTSGTEHEPLLESDTSGENITEARPAETTSQKHHVTSDHVERETTAHALSLPTRRSRELGVQFPKWVDAALFGDHTVTLSGEDTASPASMEGEPHECHRRYIRASRPTPDDIPCPALFGDDYEYYRLILHEDTEDDAERTLASREGRDRGAAVRELYKPLPTLRLRPWKQRNACSLAFSNPTFLGSLSRHSSSKPVSVPAASSPRPLALTPPLRANNEFLVSTRLHPLDALQLGAKPKYSNMNESQAAVPALWRVSAPNAILQPQTFVICLSLAIIQFGCLERFLAGHTVLLSIALHKDAAAYYQYIFGKRSSARPFKKALELIFPFGTYGVFYFFVSTSLYELSLSWRQLIAILVFMNLLAALSLGICLVRILWVQLLSMGCTVILYPMLQGFALTAFLYIYGPTHVNVLVGVSMAARGMACYAWMFWQSFTAVAFPEDTQRRIQAASIISIFGVVVTVALYMLDPATYDVAKPSQQRGPELPALQRPVRIHMLGLPILPKNYPTERCFGMGTGTASFDCFGRPWILNSEIRKNIA